MPKPQAQSPEIDAPTLENYDSIAKNLLLGTILTADISRAIENPFHSKALLRADVNTLPYRSGVWVVQETVKSATAQRNLVLHWPLILDRLLSKSKSSLRLLDPIEAHMAKQAMLRTVDSAGRQQLMEALEHQVLRGLPAGITVPCPTYLHNYLHKRYKESKDSFIAQFFERVTILRFGPLLTHKGQHLHETLKTYSVFNTDTLPLIDTRVLLHMPLVLRLLYVALAEVRYEPPGSGWAKWGLLWGLEQLHFNHRVAAQAALAQEDTALFFEGLTLEQICESITRVPANRRILRHHKLPAFSSLVAGGQGKALHLLNRVESMQWVLEATGTQAMSPTAWRTDSSNYTTFTLTNKSTVLDYFRTLQSFNQKEIDYLLQNLGKRPEPRAPRPESVPVESGKYFVYHYEPPVEVTVNANSLGFVLPGVLQLNGDVLFVPMTIKTLAYRNKPFITLPLEFVDHFPSLKTLLHDGLKEIAKKYPTQMHVRDRDIYFDLEILTPDGDVAALMLSEIRSSTTKYNREQENYATAYRMWCQWFLDPKQCRPEPVGEFRVAYKAYFVNTVVERFNFFRSKGKCVKKKDVTDVRNIGRSTERSGRITDYDRFVFWHIADQVISDDYVQPSDAAYAEFITKHWMPWRRPSGNIPHLRRIRGLAPPMGAPVGPKEATVAYLLNYVKEFDVPFTRDAPRTGKLLTHYLYEDDYKERKT